MRGGFLFLDHVHNSAEVYQHLAAEVGSSADRGRSLLVNMPSWHSDSQSSNKSLKLWLMDDTCVSPFCLPSGSCTFMYTLIWSPSGKDSAMDCEVGVQVDPCSRCQCRPKVCLLQHAPKWKRKAILSPLRASSILTPSPIFVTAGSGEVKFQIPATRIAIPRDTFRERIMRHTRRHT